MNDEVGCSVESLDSRYYGSKSQKPKIEKSEQEVISERKRKNSESKPYVEINKVKIATSLLQNVVKSTSAHYSKRDNDSPLRGVLESKERLN